MTGEATVSESSVARLERLIRRARLALVWERLWPPLAACICIAVIFLTLSWMGLWDVLPHMLRAVGVVIFAFALLAAAFPIFRLRRPERSLILARLDRDAGIAHRPATALGDGLATRADDPFTRALWEAHRLRAEESSGGLRVPLPSPRLDRLDPRAFRFLLGLVAAIAFVAAGSDRGDRVAAAFDWWAPRAEMTPPRVDAWVAPPPYTGRPPLFLTASGGDSGSAVSVPIGSTVLVRTSGGSVAIEPGGQLRPIEAATGDAGKPAAAVPAAPAPPASGALSTTSSAGGGTVGGEAQERRFSLTGDGTLRVSGAGVDAREWIFAALPDLPPTIALKSDPLPSNRGGLALAYTVSDDYGVISAEAHYIPAARKGRTAPRPLYEAPKTALTLPQARIRSGEAVTTVDLPEHPWAGARVEMTLVARDEAGQEGHSVPHQMDLPARSFLNPLARSLVEQRRELALDAGARQNVTKALDALALFPDQFAIPAPVYLGLRTAYWRLSNARTDDDLRGVADYLWEMALQIEDGDMSDVERQLQAAQEALKQALERGASDEEIKQLTEKLRQAMNEFMRELAKRAPDAQPDPRGRDPNTRMVRPQDLQNMLDRMEQLAKKGDRDAAKDMLAELSQMLNGLRNAQRMPRNPNAEAMSRMLDELGDMIREQSQLRDKTFQKGGVGNGDPSRRAPNQQRSQRGQNGKQGEEGGEPGAMEELAQAQRQLRERLQQMQRQLQQRGMQGEQGLGDAGEAMQGAEGSLGSGEAGEAVDQQGRALDALRKGAQSMANQMAGEGQDGEPGGPGQANARRGQGEDFDTDPLGRPTRSRTYDSGNSVKVPGEIEAQRARRVLEDIRRRLSEPERPQEELQYLERLLEQ